MTEMSVKKACCEKNLLWFRVLRVLFAVIVGVVVLLGIFVPSAVSQEREYRIKCNACLRSLGAALYIYAQEHSNCYPKPDKWCDLLVMNYEVKLESLVCKGSDAKIGESSYALNKNIAGKNS